MMNYMRDGGMNMWLLLAVAIGAAVLAVVRPKQARPGILLGGSWLCLVFGILGLALGMEAVSAHYTRFDDPVAALGTGLGELANNGTFAAALAFVLGIASAVTRRMQRAATA